MKRLIPLLGRAVLALGVALGIGWGVVVVAIVRAGGEDRAAPADAIVVLGAAQYDGRPSPVLKGRLDHALALWKRGLAPRIVLTGGRGEGDTTSEAAVGQRYAQHAGVPDSVLLLEGRGRSTRESIAGVAALAREQAIRRVILVSDPMHLFRASILAAEHGLTAVTSPVRPGSLRRDWRALLAESVKAPVAWMARFAD